MEKSMVQKWERISEALMLEFVDKYYCVDGVHLSDLSIQWVEGYTGTVINIQQDFVYMDTMVAALKHSVPVEIFHDWYAKSVVAAMNHRQFPTLLSFWKYQQKNNPKRYANT